MFKVLSPHKNGKANKNMYTQVNAKHKLSLMYNDMYSALFVCCFPIIAACDYCSSIFSLYNDKVSTWLLRFDGG